MRVWRIGITLALAATTFTPLLGVAQEPRRVPHLGYISPGDIPHYDNAFLQGLQEQGFILPGEIPRYDAASWQQLLKQGYFEGKKIRIDFRATGQDFARAPQLASELVSLNVDAIFAIPALLVKAAQDAVRKANKSTPIIFGSEFDPVGFGFVKSLARPGGNMTGVAIVDPEFDAKQLEILKETFPRLSRVAYLTNPAWHPDYYLRSEKAMETAAKAMGIKLEIVAANTLEELDRALAEIARGRIQGLVLPQNGPLLFAHRARVRDLAANNRLPAIYGDALWVEEGGLMFYGSSVADRKRRSAALVARVLRGANPGEIPVEQPTTYKLVLNVKTARTLGLTFPREILSRADQVIRKACYANRVAQDPAAPERQQLPSAPVVAR
jgi:putative ABC transport system substrate-binding protein